jgi:hypothetical protein
MNRSIAVTLALAVSGILSAGCATIVKGSTQTITVSSNVDGADVFLDGLKVGTTPFAGPVPKNKGALMVQKPGYRAANLSLSKSLEPMFWGNIITGGTLGSITDFASGSAYQYAPAAYQVDLRPEGQAQTGFERRVAARKFAMLYLDRVSADLAVGSGEHLRALLAIVNGDRSGGADAAAIRDALVSSGADPVRFGNKVVELI